MNCSKCQTALHAGAKFCGNCGQMVAPPSTLSMPCVVCETPIPEGAEDCPQCAVAAPAELKGEVPSLASPAPAPQISIVGGAVQIAAGSDPLESDAPMDAAALAAFQLDAIEIPPPPPPPPVVPKSSRVQSSDPLPTLTGSGGPDEVAVKSKPARDEKKPALEPKPPTDEELDELLALVTTAVQESQPKPAEKPLPAAATPASTPASVQAAVVSAQPVKPAPAAASAVSPAPAPAVAAANAPTVIVRKPVIPQPPVEEDVLGPQPEDVPDEDAIRRRKALMKLIAAGVALIVLIGLGLFVLGGGLRSKPSKPVMTELAKPVQLHAEPVSAASAVTQSAESVPEETFVPETSPGIAPKPQVAPHAEAKPAPKPTTKPVNKRSEEDAYLRQIRRQLEQR